MNKGNLNKPQKCRQIYKPECFLRQQLWRTSPSQICNHSSTRIQSACECPISLDDWQPSFSFLRQFLKQLMKEGGGCSEVWCKWEAFSGRCFNEGALPTFDGGDLFAWRRKSLTKAQSRLWFFLVSLNTYKRGGSFRYKILGALLVMYFRVFFSVI